MTPKKDRLTVTVDRVLLEAANAAVADGAADSLSAWVNRALEERVVKERRLAALHHAIAAYERTFGAITDAEMALQARADRDSAIVIRRTPKRTAAKRPRKARSAA